MGNASPPRGIYITHGILNALRNFIVKVHIISNCHHSKIINEVALVGHINEGGGSAGQKSQIWTELAGFTAKSIGNTF